MSAKPLRYQKNEAVSHSVLPSTLSMLTIALSVLGLSACSSGAQSSERAETIINAEPPAAQVAIAEPQLPLLLAAPTVAPQARQAVLQAKDAVEAKRWNALPALASQAKEDPVLGAYPQYWWLRQQLQDSRTVAPADSLRHFLRTYPDHYLAERLKGDWSLVAMRGGDYALINELNAADLGNPQTRCAQSYARHMAGQAVDSQTVLSQFRPGASCWTMLDQLYADHAISWQDVRGLMRNALEAGKAAEARRLAAIIFTPAQMKDYTALLKSPQQWLKNQGSIKDRGQQELVTLALSRLGRDENRAAQAAYIQQSWQTRIPRENMDWVWGQFGLTTALRVEPEAARWYRLSGATPKTDYNHAWEVRAELREPVIDWTQVQAAIAKMSARQAAEPVWVYWKGRALQAQGQTAEANALFESITGDLNFYGQLAHEELGRLPQLPARPASVSAQEIADMRLHPGLMRSLELFRLGWRPEAVSEWSFALRGMSDRQLRAAAELARQEHIYDRVVNTSLLTRQEIDFDQRFIAPFEDRVAEKAELVSLDPAWVYGLIRQESRFITDARSGVGASGLMQLMPGTAKWVANKIGMSNFTPSSVNDFDTNTILGTNYLNMVLQQLDGSEVLASAGYNAGPKRPILWRSRLQAPVEGAIFAETIPFTETRLYVKNVLSNATYYSMMFTGEPQSLKRRLGVISPTANSVAALP